ncbi:MAG: M55 family metallopeptidase [Cellulosilyticaceae bacterium]
MKIFISADIEGITGVSTWEEAALNPPYDARERMTKEVASACRGAIVAGVRDVIIKDAHGNGKNLIYTMLPKIAKVISGWSGHPYTMVEGLDDTFDGIVFIGYHSHAGSNASPLSHTLDPKNIKNIYINEQIASEFTIFSYAARMLNIPIIAVSGDGGLIREVNRLDKTIPTVAVQEGFGGAVVSVHPNIILERIEQAVQKGITKIEEIVVPPMPPLFNVKVEFKKHKDAYKCSFYPGAKQIDEFTISYTCEDYMDVLKLLLFL